MKLSKVSLGDLVAVNKCPDGQVYHVVNQQGFMLELYYKQNGYTLNGGWLDIGSCRKPTKAQLANYEKTK